jgi:prolyl-tRNA synthetase
MNKLTKRSENFSNWYNELVYKSGLIDQSDVRGCMILKPYGYAIWEKIQSVLNEKIKKTGHQNVYFPLLIPKSFFSKESNHIEGFAKECAIVTHYRLKTDENKKIEVDPCSKLEEELIIRPTSETVIWNSFKNWIKSYRDLPVLINQWANVMRWEMRTRPFLRTSEILWQEGHTAHEFEKEAIEESLKMLDIYDNFGKEFLSIPFIKGKKSESEKFAGAEKTYTIEAIMQDGKALQCGTSHFLGQNFSKAFEVLYNDKYGKLSYPFGTSWGVTTRLIGALIMTHGDDQGLVLPPKIAPIQVVMISVFKTNEEKDKIVEIFDQIKIFFDSENISYKVDISDNQTPGWKFSEYELKGVPIRIVIGPKDLENKTVEVYRRDKKEKIVLSVDNLNSFIKKLLSDIQENLYQKALEMRKNMTQEVFSYKDFKEIISEKKGFIICNWNGSAEVEKRIREETKATIRCIINEKSEKKCIYSGEKGNFEVMFAQAY